MPNNEWPTLQLLASKTEQHRRIILRPHTEIGFESENSAQDMAIRDALDGELDELATLALKCEFHDPDAIQFANVPDLQQLLDESPAFGQYLNIYLYFSIRFATGRISNPCISPERAQTIFNETTVGLPIPPRIDQPHVKPNVEKFLGLKNTREADEALAFLDDFVEQPGESTKYELWLRGLYSATDRNPRFLRLTKGLLDWASLHSDFYVSPGGPAGSQKSPGLAGGAGGGGPMEGQQSSGCAMRGERAVLACANSSRRGIPSRKSHVRIAFLALLPSLAPRTPGSPWARPNPADGRSPPCGVRFCLRTDSKRGGHRGGMRASQAGSHPICARSAGIHQGLANRLRRGVRGNNEAQSRAAVPGSAIGGWPRRA
jgi:hypothetical protein